MKQKRNYAKRHYAKNIKLPEKKSFVKKAALLSLATFGILGVVLLTAYTVAPEEVKEEMLQLPGIATPQLSLQNMNPVQTKIWKKLLPGEWLVSDEQAEDGGMKHPEFNFTLAFLEFSGGGASAGNGSGDGGIRVIVITEPRNEFGVTPIEDIIREKVIELIRLPYENGTGGAGSGSGGNVMPPGNIIIINQTIITNNSGTGGGTGNGGTGSGGSTGGGGSGSGTGSGSGVGGGSSGTGNAGTNTTTSVQIIIPGSPGACGNAVVAYSGPAKRHDNGLILMPEGSCRIYLSGSANSGSLLMRMWRSGGTYSLPAVIGQASYSVCNNTMNCNAQLAFTQSERFLSYYVETASGSDELTKLMLSYECG